MNRHYSNYWWIYLARGIFAILFGIATLILAQPAFATLVIFFGSFMIIDGVLSIVTFDNAKRAIKNKQWLFFVGITGIAAGILTIFSPFISAIILVCFFTCWSFFAGIMDMMRALSLRKERRKEGWYVLSGIVCILVAILLFIKPHQGPIILAIIFTMYAFVTGISLISLAIRLRKHSSMDPERKIMARSSI